MACALLTLDSTNTATATAVAFTAMTPMNQATAHAKGSDTSMSTTAATTTTTIILIRNAQASRRVPERCRVWSMHPIHQQNTFRLPSYRRRDQCASSKSRAVPAVMIFMSALCGFMCVLHLCHLSLTSFNLVALQMGGVIVHYAHFAMLEMLLGRMLCFSCSTIYTRSIIALIVLS